MIEIMNKECETKRREEGKEKAAICGSNDG
jgi:hypothetical protein